MLDLNDFLPDSRWRVDWKSAAKDPKTLAAAAALALVMGPFTFLALEYSLAGYILYVYVKRQREKKVQAILETMPGRYTEAELTRIAAKDPKELNRLFRLASDEFFRKYIAEQADHRKAQDLIAQMQLRLDHMRARMAELQKKADVHEKAIRDLQAELSTYEEIFANWTRTARAA